jgi:uncharacterized protein with gpF-like domain
MTNAMIEDYRAAVDDALKNHSVQSFFAQDAAAASVFKSIFKKLEEKWTNIFESFAKKTADEFVDQSDDHAKSSTFFCMKNMGVKQPDLAYSENVMNTLGAAKDFNYTLITGIQQDVHERIYKSVMLSLTSPNPEEQGQSGIENTLKEIGGFSKDRIKLISRDQTSKLYSALSDERMERNGLDEFEWMHSSAGKVPRQTHLDKDGEIFKLNDPRLWEGPKADQGPPGWAINCRCRKRFIIR